MNVSAVPDAPRIDAGALPLCFFVRHGETAWNKEGRLQGQADTLITEEGRLQADRNGRKLKELLGDPQDFDFVASPMKRTRETMERIRGVLGVDPKAYRTDPRLVELSFGDWQGRTYTELEREEPGAYARRTADKWGFVPPGEGAESYAMLALRVAPYVREIERPTVCVTHGGVIRSIFVLLGALAPDDASLADTPQDQILRLRDGRLEWL
ncbi:MAG TPA: histidine phosphatase family protein [Mesorhizobium sp.]|nr:histidine phosphatase family protein [Mesorhizobium sp.]